MHDVEKRLAFEPYAAQVAVERFGIIEAAVVVEPDLRAVGQHETPLAVLARNHKDPVLGLQKHSCAECAKSQRRTADGGDGCHAPPRSGQARETARFRGRDRRNFGHRPHQPFERLLIRGSVHRAELRGVPLLKQLFLRDPVARMFVQPAAELLLHLGGHVVVREIRNDVSGLLRHGLFRGEAPRGKNAGKAPRSAVILLHIQDDSAGQHPYAGMKIKFRKFPF